MNTQVYHLTCHVTENGQERTWQQRYHVDKGKKLSKREAKKWAKEQFSGAKVSEITKA